MMPHPRTYPTAGFFKRTCQLYDPLANRLLYSSLRTPRTIDAICKVSDFTSVPLDAGTGLSDA